MDGKRTIDGSGLVVQGLTKQLGGNVVVHDLSLTVAPGELCCLLGPSGCGKTTTLRMIGGFILPERGGITVNGKDITTLAPEKRPTAMVFQNYALWPHMTVFKNVAFGLNLRRLPKAEVADRVQSVLEMVNLQKLRDRRPGQLSGGEQQRVALARALVLEPEVLLLDEPLSNLDARLRVTVREEIREIQKRLKITTIFVTHDQDEALSISDRVAVMSGGRIEQLDDAAALYRLPRTSFVAGFVGSMNAYRGRIGPDGLFLSAPAHRTGPSAEHGPVDCGADREDLALVAGDWDVVVRPEDVVVEERPGMPALPATLASVIPHGHFNEAVLRVGHEGGHMAGGGGAAHGAAGGLTVRAFVPADMVLPGAVRARFRRLLLYRDGVLMHEVGRQTKTASPPAPSLDGHRQVALRP